VRVQEAGQIKSHDSFSPARAHNRAKCPVNTRRR
jgi:hypothetical protein